MSGPLAPCSCEESVYLHRCARRYISEQKIWRAPMPTPHTGLGPQHSVGKPLPSLGSPTAFCPAAGSLSAISGTLVVQVHITAGCGGGAIIPALNRLKRGMGGVTGQLPLHREAL